MGHDCDGMLQMQMSVERGESRAVEVVDVAELFRAASEL
jgi:hypothetical protein